MAMSLVNKKKELLALLEKLNSFPKTKTVRQLQRELKEQLSRIDARISKTSKKSQKREEQKSEESKQQRRQEANAERSRWMKGVHRYVRLIHSMLVGTPDELPYREILRMFFQRRKGRKVSIPDVIWQNPSI